MNEFALPFFIMLVGVVLEGMVLRWKNEAVSWLSIVANLNSGHMVMWLGRCIEVTVFAWVLGEGRHGVGNWPVWAQWLFAFFAWDFCFYWLHRLHHKIGLLWAVHVVHHQGEHYNLSQGVRNSWYSSITSIPFFVWLAVIGLPLPVFVMVSSFHYAMQLINHNGVVKHMGWLEHILITPNHHRLHHATNPEYREANFGGTLLMWDKLFGTFQRQLPRVGLTYGMASGSQGFNPVWENNKPVLVYLGLKRFVTSSSISPISIRLGEYVVLSGAVLLFVQLVFFVHYQGAIPGVFLPVQAALVVAGTFALGAVSEGRKWGSWAWLGVDLGLLTAYLIFMPGVLSLWLDAVVCLCLHGVITLWWVVRTSRLSHGTLCVELPLARSD